jgi:DNA-binding protein HU-beta
MNKAELVEALSERGLSKKDAKVAIDALFGTDDGIISDALKRGDSVQITGFGKFEARQREGRTGRNPRTGKPVEIAPSIAPRFSAGKSFRDALNG